MNKKDSKWYVLRIVGGREEKKLAEIEAVWLKNNLLSEVDELKFFGKIKQEFKGLIFCRCHINQELVRSVRKVKGVAGFLARGEKGELPAPATPATMERIFASLAEVELQKSRYSAYSSTNKVKIGDLVRINQGAFADHEGRIIDYNPKKTKVKLILEKLGWELLDVPLTDCEKAF